VTSCPPITRKFDEGIAGFPHEEGAGGAVGGGVGPGGEGVVGGPGGEGVVAGPATHPAPVILL